MPAKLYKPPHVGMLRTRAAGHVVILDLLGPGNLFGEMALLDRKQRSADRVAFEANRLLPPAWDDFVTYLNQYRSRPVAPLQVAEAPA